jgi:hypothetical protein
VATLSRPEYVGVPATLLRRGFDGRFDFGQGRFRTVPDFNVFYRDDTNEPSSDKAAWVLQHLRDRGLCHEPAALNFTLGRSVFRQDMFEQAVRFRGLLRPSRKNEVPTQPQLIPA